MTPTDVFVLICTSYAFIFILVAILDAIGVNVERMRDTLVVHTAFLVLAVAVWAGVLAYYEGGVREAAWQNIYYPLACDTVGLKEGETSGITLNVPVVEIETWDFEISVPGVFSFSITFITGFNVSWKEFTLTPAMDAETVIAYAWDMAEVVRMARNFLEVLVEALVLIFVAAAIIIKFFSHGLIDPGPFFQQIISPLAQLLVVLLVLNAVLAGGHVILAFLLDPQNAEWIALLACVLILLGWPEGGFALLAFTLSLDFTITFSAAAAYKLALLIKEGTLVVQLGEIFLSLLLGIPVIGWAISKLISLLDVVSDALDRFVQVFVFDLIIFLVPLLLGFAVIAALVLAAMFAHFVFTVSSVGGLSEAISPPA